MDERRREEMERERLGRVGGQRQIFILLGEQPGERAISNDKRGRE